MQRLFLFLILSSSVLFAELPPSVYERLQAKAPEYLEIEVLRVDVEPGGTPNQQKVQIMALVNKVMRSVSNLKEGDLINILYTVTDQPKDRRGPREIPILSEKDKTVAYLIKTAGTNNYIPAAKAMTFQNF